MIERIARDGGGNPLSVNFPNPQSGRGSDSDCHFSFSGIKTYAKETIERLEKDPGTLLDYFFYIF